MKKLTIWVFAALFLSSCAWGSCAFAKEFKIASEEWPPYAYSENGKMTGYSTDIIIAVLGKLGATAEIKAYPWARAEAMALAGDADGLYNASRKEKREAACHYPDEKLFDSEYVFFIRTKDQGKLAFNSFEDLNGKKVGVTRAYSYNTEFWDYLKVNRNYLEAPTDEINFKMLAEGRIDYFPAEKGNGFALIKKLNLADKVMLIDKPFVQKPYFLIFNKKNVDREFVDRFGGELKAFKMAPGFQAIKEKYFK